jgi:hypothetical protein
LFLITTYKTKVSYIILHNKQDLAHDYLLTKKLIKQENDLLYSYNINVQRNNRDQIEKTANYCGLKVKF